MPPSEALESASAGIVEADPRARALAGRVGLMACRFAQETLTNAFRPCRASRIGVALQFEAVRNNAPLRDPELAGLVVPLMPQLTTSTPAERAASPRARARTAGKSRRQARSTTSAAGRGRASRIDAKGQPGPRVVLTAKDLNLLLATLHRSMKQLGLHR